MIVIAGGGIGGLTLGCALSQARKPFRIFERAVELRPVGAGIALSPNAFQAFAHIGMDDRVRRCGWDLEVADLCDSKGRVLIRARVPKLASGLTKAMTRANLQQARSTWSKIMDRWRAALFRANGFRSQKQGD